MLGINNLNGLLLPTTPPSDGGLYEFRVLERYYDRARGGGDLAVTYRYWVAGEDLQFTDCDFGGQRGVVLGVRPSAFDRLCEQARRRGVDDLAVYPAFPKEKEEECVS